MSKAIRTFKNVRARIRRASDGVWLPGWVVHLAQDEARIRLQNFTLIRDGECFNGECFGDGTLVRFTGRVLGQAGQDVSIGIVGSMTFEPSSEPVRLQVENIAGTLICDRSVANLIVLDISPKSLGGLVDRSFAPSTTLEMVLETPIGSLSAKVKVANCRADHEQTGHFRLGLHLTEIARLDAAMWQRLLEDRAAM